MGLTLYSTRRSLNTGPKFETLVLGDLDVGFGLEPTVQTEVSGFRNLGPF